MTDNFSHNRLIYGAIANAKNTTFGEKSLWAVVKDIFGIGSTWARELCIEHKFDPEKQLPPIVCPECENDLIYIWGTEDDMIVLNKEGSWIHTIYASCPEQAKRFVESFKNSRFNTIEEWDDAYHDFDAGWQCYEESGHTED